MNDNFLSQEEINTLLGKASDNSENDKFVLGDIEKDILGEVGNISMSTAATTLSSILNHQVKITTPRVSWTPIEQIRKECEVPKVVAIIEFKAGINGNNLLMMDVRDASVIADLMMGGDGSNTLEELDDLQLSAVSEAMNQMIGSASTSMATMFNKSVDILPPDVTVWKENVGELPEKFTKEDNICKIAFDLTVEGLIESEIMQVFTRESVEEIVSIMTGNDEQYLEETQAETLKMDSEVVEKVVVQEEPARVERPAEKVVVQKPSFPPLDPSEGESSRPRNLDLIMDVPLEFSVVLGKTKKTIKDVLSFNNGSVVELNKLADEPLEIYVNGKLIAHGEVVIINENFGIRITKILSKEQRVQRLR